MTSELTPQELRELLVTVKQNQATMASLSEQIKDIHQVVIGNGRHRESLLGRLQLVEERQKVGATKQNEICDDIEGVQTTLDAHTALLEKDHSRIKDLAEAQAADRKNQTELKQTIEAWRNKAVGIGIGVGIGTGAGLFGLSQLIAKISEGVVP
jgi:chromosome segregation ATPase